MMKAMVVDDNKSKAMLYIDKIEDKGIFTLYASDGHDALGKLAMEELVFVLCDIRMQGGPDGFQVRKVAIEQYGTPTFLYTDGDAAEYQRKHQDVRIFKKSDEDDEVTKTVDEIIETIYGSNTDGEGRIQEPTSM